MSDPNAAPTTGEQQRLDALRALRILDTPPEDAFDDLVRLAASICDVPMALVSLVDSDRQWFKAKVGIAASETSRSFCSQAIQSDDDIFIVPDTHADERFARNPLVTGEPRIRFYAGAPLRLSDGTAVGTLCVLDIVPRVLSADTRSALLVLKRRVEANLELRFLARSLATSSLELAETERSREALVQFGLHDMKNALSVVLLNSQTLRDDVSPLVQEIARDIELAGDRLNRLVVDMMDVARAERAGKLLACREPVDVDGLVAEVTGSFLRRLGEASVSLKTSVSGLRAEADPALIKRILQNLIDNAVRNSPSGSELVVTAERRGEQTLLVVADNGPGVPAAMQETIFNMYEQGDAARSGSCGIGLAFCRVAAAAHGGRIWVEPNDPTGSRFCVAF